jgi:ubiquitin C-terminal hydrolase
MTDLVTDEIAELKNPFMHIYTPVEFKLTQIMSTHSSKQVDSSNNLNSKKEELKNYQSMLSKYENTPLPKASTIGLKNLGNNCYMNSIV